MYLAISVVTAFAALAAAICEMCRANKLRNELRCKTFEAESFQRVSESMEQCWNAEQNLHHAAIDQRDRLRKALQESEDTACRLRQQLQTVREELTLSEEEYDGCTRKLTNAQNEAETLKKERRKLEEKLIAERESAAHWKEEHDRQVRYRLADQGRIYREISNILAYDGTSAGQEDLND